MQTTLEDWFLLELSSFGAVKVHSMLSEFFCYFLNGGGVGANIPPYQRRRAIKVIIRSC